MSDHEVDYMALDDGGLEQLLHSVVCQRARRHAARLKLKEPYTWEDQMSVTHDPTADTCDTQARSGPGSARRHAMELITEALGATELAQCKAAVRAARGSLRGGFVDRHE